jgi:hypothetical protein
MIFSICVLKGSIVIEEEFELEGEIDDGVEEPAVVDTRPKAQRLRDAEYHKVPALINEEPMDVVTMLGGDKPGSLYGILPDKLKKGVVQIEPPMFSLSEEMLERKIKDDDKVMVRRLRLAFWHEYHSAKAMGQKMSAQRIFGPVCNKHRFYKVMANPSAFALCLIPPKSIDIALRESLDFALDEMREILDADMYDHKTGLLDPKIADVKRRIYEDLANRVQGMPVQRTETKNLNVNYDTAGDAAVVEKMLPTTPADIDAKLKELDEALNSGQEEG